MPFIEESTHIANPSVRESEARIEGDSLLVELQSKLQVSPRDTPHIAAAAEIAVVCLSVLRGLLGNGPLFLWRERDAQGLSDLLCDLVLDFEDILEFAVVAFRPNREIGASIDELRSDPQAVPRAAQATAEHESGVQLPTNFRRGDRLIAEGQHGCAGKHTQAFDFEQLGSDVFSHSIAEILIFLHSTQILEIKNCDRLLFSDSGRGR